MINFKPGYALVPALMYCITASAQQINGRLIDPDTQQPVVNARVATSLDAGHSNIFGQFALKAAVKDTLKITALGYDMYMLPVSGLTTRGMTVLMHKPSRLLSTVIISARRNRGLDSLKKRQEYATVYNYKAPTWKDAFSAPPQNVPFTFVTIDVLKLAGIINTKQEPKSKLKEMLIRDEKAEYINSRYNLKFVERLTGLQGDTLKQFTDRHYPTYEWLKRTSDYDLILFLKSKLEEK